MKAKLIISWFLMLLFVLYLSGCGAKKKHIERFISSSEVELIQDATEEKKASKITVTAVKIDSKKVKEISFLQEDTNIVADKLIIRNKDGSVSEFTNPKFNKTSSELNQKSNDENIVQKTDSLAKKEENKAHITSELNTSGETENLKRDNQTEQFNWGKLILQLFVSGVVIYLIWTVYKKLK